MKKEHLLERIAFQIECQTEFYNLKKHEPTLYQYNFSAEHIESEREFHELTRKQILLITSIQTNIKNNNLTDVNTSLQEYCENMKKQRFLFMTLVEVAMYDSWLKQIIVPEELFLDVEEIEQVNLAAFIASVEAMIPPLMFELPTKQEPDPSEHVASRTRSKMKKTDSVPNSVPNSFFSKSEPTLHKEKHRQYMANWRRAQNDEIERLEKHVHDLEKEGQQLQSKLQKSRIVRDKLDRRIKRLFNVHHPSSVQLQSQPKEEQISSQFGS